MGLRKRVARSGAEGPPRLKDVQKPSRPGGVLPPAHVGGVLRVCRLPDRTWRPHHRRSAAAGDSSPARPVCRPGGDDLGASRHPPTRSARAGSERSTRTGGPHVHGRFQRLSIGARELHELDSDAHGHDRPEPGSGGADAHARARQAESERARGASHRRAPRQGAARHATGRGGAPRGGRATARRRRERVRVGAVPSGASRVRRAARADASAADRGRLDGGEEAQERLLAA